MLVGEDWMLWSGFWWVVDLFGRVKRSGGRSYWMLGREWGLCGSCWIGSGWVEKLVCWLLVGVGCLVNVCDLV